MNPVMPATSEINSEIKIKPPPPLKIKPINWDRQGISPGTPLPPPLFISPQHNRCVFRVKPWPATATAATEFCHFFLKGLCREGSTCKFGHPIIDMAFNAELAPRVKPPSFTGKPGLKVLLADKKIKNQEK